MGYGSMLSAVFKSVLPEISISPLLHVFVFSAMDNYFSTGFDPQDVIFASLITAKRGGEIQALSRRVSFSSSAAGLSYVPELVAKTESALQPLSRSSKVPSLGDLA